MKALATDPSLLDEFYLLSGCCQPDRCQPACRPPTEDDNHEDPDLPVFITLLLPVSVKNPGEKSRPGNADESREKKVWMLIRF
jgi:hypothetical protein